MADREKVIKALKTCIAAQAPGSDATCEECPYFECHECDGEMMSDALKVIEESGDV